jgi:hypothetical protein
LRKQRPASAGFLHFGRNTLQITRLLNLKTPGMAARFSHLNLTVREKLVNALFAGVRSVTSARLT